MTDQPDPVSDQPKPVSDKISFDDFVKIKLRVGKVIEASDHPNADKLLVLKVVFLIGRFKVIAEP